MKELPFHDELSIVKNKIAFSGYSRSYKIEIVDKKDVIVQLKASEISIKELFKGRVRYIFASLFFKSKREHLSN